MDGLFVGIIVIIIIAIGAISWLFGEFSVMRENLTHTINLWTSERKLLSATENPQIVRTMLWLRDDISSSFSRNRIDQKLGTICEDPDVAIKAFRTALICPDKEMQLVGIKGLSHLKDPQGIEPLIKYYKDPNNQYWKDETAEILIELSNLTTTDDFILIFNTICSPKYHDPENLYRNFSYLRKLLNIASTDPVKYSRDVFDNLIRTSERYAYHLINSGTTSSRHEGEDFLADIQEKVLERDGNEYSYQTHLSAGDERISGEEEKRQRHNQTKSLADEIDEIEKIIEQAKRIKSQW